MFTTEKELVEVITQNQEKLYPLAKWSTKSRPTILSELDLGYGIADLVLAENHDVQCERNQQLYYHDIFVHMIIERHGLVTFERLQELTHDSGRKLKNSLAKLTDEGFVTNDSSGYQAIKGKFNEIEAVAFEAKLKNWKRALKQAYRYQWFASYSYVIMDAKYIKPAFTNKNMFEKYNIGLASVTIEGDIEVLIRPKKNKPVDEVMHYLLSERLFFRS